MKNLLLTVVCAIFMILSFSSCKKNYNCECTSITNPTYSFTTVISDSKSNAKSECAAKTAIITDPTTGQTAGVECEIK